VLAVAGLSDPASGYPLTSLSPGGLFGHPGVGALLVTALLGYVGVPPGATEAWALPAAFAVAAVIGVLYGAWLRSARPNVYQGIGLGADALADLEERA
jgi:hypothetical protein